MPFRSKAQMRYLFANKPKVAEKWEKKYGVPKYLPEKKSETMIRTLDKFKRK